MGNDEVSEEEAQGVQNREGYMKKQQKQPWRADCFQYPCARDRSLLEKYTQTIMENGDCNSPLRLDEIPNLPHFDLAQGSHALLYICVTYNSAKK